MAYQVARALGAPLDVLIVRKIGMPGQPEFAIGAIASGNIMLQGAGIVGQSWQLEDAFRQVVEHERRELDRREQVYRPGRPPLELKDKTVVLVDDGLATGSTMLAAVRSARKAGAAAVIVAAPVGSSEAEALLTAEADEVIVLQTPPMLFSIGEWYERFEQLEDAEVCRLLSASPGPERA